MAAARKLKDLDTELRRDAAMAALELANEKPWDLVSVHAVANKADIALETIYDMDGKSGLLAEIDKVFDRAMGVDLDSLPVDAQHAERRERLAQVMMQRLDAMEPYRIAIGHIHEYVNNNPTELAKAGARRMRTAQWALSAADIDEGVGGLRALALAATFMRAKRVWLKDEAPCDTTHAAIDKDLRSYADVVGDVSTYAHKVKDFFKDLGSNFQNFQAGFAGTATGAGAAADTATTEPDAEAKSEDENTSETTFEASEDFDDKVADTHASDETSEEVSEDDPVDDAVVAEEGSNDETWDAEEAVVDEADEAETEANDDTDSDDAEDDGEGLAKPPPPLT